MDPVQAAHKLQEVPEDLLADLLVPPAPQTQPLFPGELQLPGKEGLSRTVQLQLRQPGSGPPAVPSACSAGEVQLSIFGTRG